MKKQPIHIMVDLETLATCPKATIATIGACVFDPIKQTIGEKFYVRLDLRQPGRTSDLETIMWWMQQSDNARKEIYDKDRESFTHALNMFRAWVFKQCGKNEITEEGIQNPAPNATIWSNGPTFDEVILRDAYEGTPFLFPFHFRNSRCVRTVFQFCIDAGMKKGKGKRTGEHHNACDDAVYQAECVNAAYAELGMSNEGIDDLIKDMT